MDEMKAVGRYKPLSKRVNDVASGKCRHMWLKQLVALQKAIQSNTVTSEHIRELRVGVNRQSGVLAILCECLNKPTDELAFFMTGGVIARRV